MAFSSRNHVLLASVLVYVFVCRFGQAYNYPYPGDAAYEYPHLGAASVVANEYLAEAEDEGETGQNYPQAGQNYPQAGQNYPQAGIINTNPAALFSKALECLSDKYIYRTCDEAYRLTENGELHVPPEYTEEYCNGPCLSETNHALDCIYGILKHFKFYNEATLHDVRETIESGCSYGPKRGNFDVIEHIQGNDCSKNKASNTVVYAILAMIIGWRMLL